MIMATVSLAIRIGHRVQSRGGIPIGVSRFTHRLSIYLVFCCGTSNGERQAIGPKYARRAAVFFCVWFRVVFFCFSLQVLFSLGNQEVAVAYRGIRLIGAVFQGYGHGRKEIVSYGGVIFTTFCVPALVFL